MKLGPVIEILSLKRQQEEANIAKTLKAIAEIDRAVAALSEQEAAHSQTASDSEAALTFQQSFERWRIWRDQQLSVLVDSKAVLQAELKPYQDRLKAVLLQEDAMRSALQTETLQASMKDADKKNQDQLEIWVAQLKNI